jgi:tRNA dimethylallyltransferase
MPWGGGRRPERRSGPDLAETDGQRAGGSRRAGSAAARDGSVEVIAVFGPTASGKSAVGEALAERLGTEVVSADSMQAYRGLPILTNQPDRPTRLVGIWPLVHEGSVGEYQRLAHAAIDELVTAHGVAVVVGGTGLYLRAALADLALPPAPAAGERRRWEDVYDADPAAAYEELVRRDPRAAGAVHANDRRRVVRALELAASGRSLAPGEERLWSGHCRRRTLLVGLAVPPGDLATRIARRADAMFERGVVDEVREALARPISRTAERALGLREIAALPHGEARDRIVVRTRQYAAYQRKWMRRIPNLVEVDATRPVAEVVDEILEMARAR